MRTIRPRTFSPQVWFASGKFVYILGFGTFLKTREFSDLKLIAPEFNREYHVHKLILSYASEYFEKKLDSLSETDNQMTLEGPFAKDFELALRYQNNKNNSNRQDICMMDSSKFQWTMHFNSWLPPIITSSKNSKSLQVTS
jgi:hypothetical protein